MNERNKITILKVGHSGDPLCVKVGRGVFNLESVLNYLSQPLNSISNEITIDLSQVGWISLFNWWAFTCILHGQLKNRPDLKIRLDFVGGGGKELIPYGECANYRTGRMISPRFSDGEYNDSYSVHRVLNFVKSLEGPRGFENVARGQIVLARQSLAEAERPGWYRRDPDVENSIILPRTSVGAKEMCLKFASRSQIELWREAMATKRVPNAAVFQSSEFWRVLCHELARNVVEHAGGPGFIAGRVVLPQAGKWPHWCHDVYGRAALDQLNFTEEHGFVELCVSDAGVGVPKTIESSYRKRYRERHGTDLPHESISHADLLKFAFDELSTSKDADKSWVTDRHALGHILFIVEKYGGILTICSKNASLTYCAGKSKFKRCTTQLGFEPQISSTMNPAIPGTHLQMLIPLTPLSIKDSSSRSTFYLPIPPSFHVDHRHPVGPLVPVRDKLGVLCMGIEGDDTFKFKEASRALARELLRGSHPRSQLLVFDFSEVDWVPAQFETFLYLMQNVILNRLVLFTQVPQELAELVNSQEDEDRPTYLPDAMREDIHKRALDREFTDGRFLETYSSMGALVLALGPDHGEYLFGVKNRELRAALLELINNERQTLQDLCEAHMIDPHVLSAVLHHASQLFRPDDLQRWGSVFVRGEPDRDDLEVQRLRAITEHFDTVAKHCDAWRGRNRNSKLPGERFYLPSENAVYMEFFESSRILARERYVLEVAERLIYRLCRGLGAILTQGLTLNDIDILACSTTPTVMIAEAIRRAWPVEREEKRPVVIDYGPSLFWGADPAHILNAREGNLRAVVVQDLFDEGTLSRKLVSLAEKQGINVLFVLSFIRFLDAAKCIGDKAQPFPPESCWGAMHPTVGKPVHAMIGLRRPVKTSKNSVSDWGVGERYRDYVVDPRSLRPVPLRSLRLESGYSEERSLTKRDSHLKEIDMDDGVCRLAAGHYVYGHRHFAVVVDIRGVLTGRIGHKIIAWLADVCCDHKERDVPWEQKRPKSLDGEVSAILLPLHSQIHYILPGLQMELAQRGRRVPHFFLDATSFGGGVETYDIPYQLQDQIEKAAKDIKTIMNSQDSDKEKLTRIKSKQLRLLFIDDAIFSGRTIQTVLDSLRKHVLHITRHVYRKAVKYQGPIDWIRAFAVLNELPIARSALWHQLRDCSASTGFQFDEYAPFIGVATFSAADCPACRKREQLEHLNHRIRDVGPTHAAEWIREREEQLAALTTEGPSFRKTQSRALPDPIDVLALPGGGAPERYKPIHADSAIWRFYELMYLSYPIGDVLKCLKTTQKAGLDHPNFRDEYARFRLAVYDWCIQNWHQVRLYHAEEQVLGALVVEVEKGESIFVEVIHRLSSVIRDESVLIFVRWSIDTLAERDADWRCIATKATLDLDTGLTLLFLALHRADLEETGLIDYLREKQAGMPRKSSFLAILYLRLTQPKVADPGWALTTIAETCFRGRFGDTAEERRTADHELLGRLVSGTARKPHDLELRRRLDGSLSAFISAVENLQPYFGDDLFSSVVSAAKKVREWLRLPLPQALNNTTPLVELDNRMQDRLAWRRFADLCHMPASQFKEQLQVRLNQLRGAPVVETGKDLHNEVGPRQCQSETNPYDSIELDVDVKPEVLGWCLMTDIPGLIAYLSNIVLEPAKHTTPSGPSRIVIKPCVPGRPQSLTIEVLTRFGPAADAHAMVSKSAKIGRSVDDLRRFGIAVTGPSCDPDCEDGLRFSLIVPVGFQH
ncbi:MAG: hypothetical protein ABSG35_17675 [Syntrophobacteraceae bacterium]